MTSAPGTLVDSTLMPTVYFPHGGGPCFFMEWKAGPADTWKTLERYLTSLGEAFAHARALLVVSAHWEETTLSVQSASNPELVYDYYGFPAHTYGLSWPAPGSPALALRVQTLLRAHEIPCRLNPDRGFDHGAFVPLKVAFPAASIPTVQLSLRSDLDPAAHVAVGCALQPLRRDGVLILGSGSSYHNAERMKSGRVSRSSHEFDEFLTDACHADAPVRNARLISWGEAPGAQEAHPRAEHLLPLMVVAGAADESRGRRTFHDMILGAPLSAFQFGGCDVS